MFELSIFLREKLIGRSTFELDEVRVGRSTDNEVQLDNLGVSRHHLTIEALSGVHVLTDLTSKNGTYVNGERVITSRALNDNDRVALGKYTLVFRGERRPPRGPEISDEAAYRVAGETLIVPVESEARERTSPVVAYLELVREGTEAPRTYPLVKDTNLVGTAPECDLHLEPGAPEHAAVIARGWKGFTVIALSLGVRHNGSPLGIVTELRPRDELAIHARVFRFHVGRPEVAT